jgi:hypothetical protein
LWGHNSHVHSLFPLLFALSSLSCPVEVFLLACLCLGLAVRMWEELGCQQYGKIGGSSWWAFPNILSAHSLTFPCPWLLYSLPHPADSCHFFDSILMTGAGQASTSLLLFSLPLCLGANCFPLLLVAGCLHVSCFFWSCPCVYRWHLHQICLFKPS